MDDTQRIVITGVGLTAPNGNNLAEYRAAHNAGRETAKRSVAQKLQNLRMRRKGVETRLSYTSKMFQTVMGMLIIKENMNFFEKLGVGSVISNMDLGELENYVTEATIEGTLHQEKLAAMLRGVSEGVDQLDGVARDAALGNFMAELDAELLGDGETPEKEHTHAGAALDTVVMHGLTAARALQQQPESKNRERE